MVSIVKMHGDVRHEEYITVERSDYNEYIERYPVVATHLSAMLITRTPFFIGYSLTDPDFQSIQAVVKSRLGSFERMSYLIDFDVSDDDRGSCCPSKEFPGCQVVSHLHALNTQPTMLSIPADRLSPILQRNVGHTLGTISGRCQSSRRRIKNACASASSMCSEKPGANTLENSPVS